MSVNIASIPGLSLWLDASDAGTVTEAGGKVTAWRDKGPHGLVFDAPVPINHTDPGKVWGIPSRGELHSLPSVRFDGASGLSIAPSGAKMFVARSPLLRKAVGVTAFAVFAASDLTYTNRAFGIGVGSAGGATKPDGGYGTIGMNAGRYRVAMGPCGTQGFGLTFRVVDEVAGSNLTGTIPPKASDRVQTTVLDYPGGVHRTYIDGVLAAEATGIAPQPTSSDTDSDYVFVGMWNYSNETATDGGPSRSGFKGDLGEVIVYDRVLTPEEIASVEVYLANKWVKNPFSHVNVGGVFKELVQFSSGYSVTDEAIPTNGLIFHIDPANPASLSGTTVTDLVNGGTAAFAAPIDVASDPLPVIHQPTGAVADNCLQFPATAVVNRQFPLSWMGWMKSDPASTDNRLMLFSNDGPSHYGFQFSNTAVKFGVGGVLDGDHRRTHLADMTATFADHQWHHMALVARSITDVSVYLDGVKVATTMSGNGGSMSFGPSPLRIGHYNNTGDGSKASLGSVGPVMEYDRALSDAEVKAIFDAQKVRFTAAALAPDLAPAFVNVAGAWKAAVEGWVRVADEWKKLWPEPKPPFDGGIVRNGDFSTPDVSQWGIGTGGSVEYDAAVGRTSPGSVVLIATVDQQSLNIHDIPITGGQTLAWDLWAMHDAIPNRVSAPFDPSHWGLQPVFADAAGTTLPDQPKIPAPVVPAVNEWVHFTGSHVAPAGAVKVRFRLMGGHVGKMWLDDVKITVT